LEKSLWQKAGPNRARTVALFAVFASLVLGSGPGFADGIGGSSGAYLRPPVGAVAAGLGGAYTASPDYYDAWWNPAVTSLLRDRRIAGGTGLRTLGRMDAFGGYDFRVPQRVGLGIMALYRGVPSLGKLYDLDERLLPNASYTTLTIKTALSYYINRKLSAGIAINVLHQSLPNYGDQAVIQYESVTGIGSFDIAAAYAVSDVWKIAAVLKNLGAKMEWQMGFAPVVEDRPVPDLTLGSSYTGWSLAGKPLVWVFDAKAYALDGMWKGLDRAELVLCSGAEWRGWDNFRVRAGLGDLSLTSDLFRDFKTYGGDFGVQITSGFSYKLSKKKNGPWINYALATDKAWAGVDQLLDVTMAF
jgi:hypothetical protein